MHGSKLGCRSETFPHARATELGWKASRHKLLWPDHPFFNAEQNLQMWLVVRPPGLDLSLLRWAWGKENKRRLAKEAFVGITPYFQPRAPSCLSSLSRAPRG